MTNYQIFVLALFFVVIVLLHFAKTILLKMRARIEFSFKEEIKAVSAKVSEETDKMNEKIEKLKRQAASERAIGNIETAKLYETKARELQQKENLNLKIKKDAGAANSSGKYECSCGASINIQVEGSGAFGQMIVNSLLASHRTGKHKLTRL